MVLLFYLMNKKSYDYTLVKVCDLYMKKQIKDGSFLFIYVVD
jgi:hypothetical protein